MFEQFLVPPTRKKMKFSNVYCSFLCHVLGSDGLGTFLDPIKTKDSALSEPLGSSGDCNRTHFLEFWVRGVGGNMPAMLVGRPF